MELRWVVFALVCAGLVWLVRGFLFATQTVKTSDRDHMLNPPEVSKGADSSPDNVIPN